MKKTAAILAILAIIIAVCAAMIRSSQQALTTQQLTAFAGRYEVQNKASGVYVDIMIKSGALEYINSWDGYKRDLGYLSGDDFMVKGFGWSVKFFRNKQHTITYLTDFNNTRWTKVDRDSSIARAARWKLMIDNSKLHPYHIDTASLKILTGNYDQQKISFKNGALYFTSSTGYQAMLTPISATAFTFDACKIEFYKAPGGGISKLAILYENGFAEPYRRNR
jgi:uncharacterized protein YjhX (UPF0386 family)